MKIVNIHLAKTQLSRLIAEVVAGGDVVIAKAGTPLVRLVAIATSQGSRSLGALAGQVVETDDCWTVDPKVEALFHESELEPRAPHRVSKRAPTRDPIRETTRAVQGTVKGTVKGTAKPSVKRAGSKTS